MRRINAQPRAREGAQRALLDQAALSRCTRWSVFLSVDAFQHVSGRTSVSHAVGCESQVNWRQRTESSTGMHTACSEARVGRTIESTHAHLLSLAQTRAAGERSEREGARFGETDRHEGGAHARERLKTFSTRTRTCAERWGDGYLRCSVHMTTRRPRRSEERVYRSGCFYRGKENDCSAQRRREDDGAPLEHDMPDFLKGERMR